MAMDWGMVGKSWAAQYDKDLVAEELTRRFKEWIPLRKAGRPIGSEVVCAWANPEENRNAHHQKCAMAMREEPETHRQWRYMYEEWPLRRKDLGWKTQKPGTWGNMGSAYRDVFPAWGRSNRFQTLACETDDKWKNESDDVDEPQLSPMGRAVIYNHPQH